ncbi:hypothetical protein PoB_005256200 [Plakobranchus ocellatus]|uniref:Uncharacterized protein n=1 Tax=Plakobranchus ocellatus TaxID=259542 RepID=A0AAV4C450_9GAST|nr:hypothetical protein PoB_005256200 [Plakobranchus ocellatus]
MAFDLLSQLVGRPVIDDDEDEGSPVDDIDEEIGEESDVECDGEGNNDLDDDTDEDLNSELDLDLGPDDIIGKYNKSRELSAVADFRKLLFAHCNWPQHGGDAYCAEKPPVAGWAKGGQRSGRAVCTSSNL